MIKQGKENEYISLSGLKKRGWTNKAISKFLGDSPDRTAPNPHYRSAAPMRLYLRAKALELENRDDFKKWIEEIKLKSKSRKESSKKAVITKTNKLIEYISHVEVKVPRYDLLKLYHLACEHYNELHCFRGNFKTANKNADISFLNRISVNFLRHELTSYEEELYNIFGKVGIREAHESLFKKIMSAISESYPSLNTECEKQKEVRFGY